MSNVLTKAPRESGPLSADAILLAESVTGGPAFTFLWHASTGQDLLRLPLGFSSGQFPISLSQSGRNTEYDAKLYEKTFEQWRETPRPKPLKQRRTPLGSRLDKIRDRIKASGQPLLSWEEIERELTERRGEGS